MENTRHETSHRFISMDRKHKIITRFINNINTKGFLLVSGSNNLVKSSGHPKTPSPECVLCEGTPCKCHQFAMEEGDGKISLKKIIHIILKRISRFQNSEECQECRHCRNECPKNNNIVKLLRDILNKANCDKKEEDSIREIIIKLLDPSVCQRNPCQIQCDPQVQQVLKAILKKSVHCNCNDCPSNCYLNEKLCRPKQFKYWFKASKEAMRKEICCRQHSENQNLSPLEGKEKQNELFLEVETPNKCNEIKRVHKYTPECCKRYKFSQRPTRYICPRYITDECPTSGNNLYPICADCIHCSICPRNSNNYVTLFCGECRAMNWPFIHFMRNGYPFRHNSERQNGLLIRTRFLQVNDFRSEEEKSVKTVYNPFHPKSNFPRKRKRSLRQGKRS